MRWREGRKGEERMPSSKNGNRHTRNMKKKEKPPGEGWGEERPLMRRRVRSVEHRL